jgi:5-methylcytosine-specific restriction enzyme A
MYNNQSISNMDAELEQVNKVMADEIAVIKDKYNKQKREIRTKYKKQQTPKPKRITIPKSVKDQLWDNSFGPHSGEGKCYVCSSSINSKKFDCGHIIAVSNGGSNDISNLNAICASCNKSMSTKNMDEFKKEYYSSTTLISKNTSNTIDYSSYFESPARQPAQHQLQPGLQGRTTLPQRAMWWGGGGGTDEPADSGFR